MPKTSKPRPPQTCASPNCITIFTPIGKGSPIYCPAHRNRHAARKINLRAAGAKERPPGYYKPKPCQFKDCGVMFNPRTGSARYCDEHQPIDHWKLANPERAAAVGRKASRRNRHAREFGDPDIYDKCVAEYGEKCAICGATPTKDFHLAIDHNHATGQRRGLLCPIHNTGLGYFADDPKLLRRAARYLERSIAA